MHYGKLYCKLMKKALKRTEKLKYSEKHHIFPVSIFGQNNKTVNLTYREHYIAHVLLEKYFSKRYGDNNVKTKKMAMAIHRMVYTKINNKNIKQYSRDFDKAKVSIKKAKKGSIRKDLIGKKFFGATPERIKEGIEKMKKALKGKKYPYKPRGSNSNKRTDEWHANISKSRQKTAEKYEKMSIEEIRIWISHQNKYKICTKYKRGPNPNITHVLALKKIPFKEYYVLSDFHDGWLYKKPQNYFLFYGYDIV